MVEGRSPTSGSTIQYKLVQISTSVGRPVRSPAVDAAALAAAGGDEHVVFLVNRDLATARPVAVGLPVGDGAAVESAAITAEGPLVDRTDWDGTTTHERDEQTLIADDGRVTVTLPPAAVV